MKILLILTLLILSGCSLDDKGEYFITNDAKLMRAFQRQCLAQRDTYLQLAPQFRDGYWKLTCVKRFKNPLSDELFPEE